MPWQCIQYEYRLSLEGAEEDNRCKRCWPPKTLVSDSDSAETESSTEAESPRERVA